MHRTLRRSTNHLRGIGVQHIHRVISDRANRVVHQGQPAIDVSKEESGKSSSLGARETPSAPHLRASHLLPGTAVGDTRRAELHLEALPTVDQSSIDTQRSSIMPASQKQSVCVSRLICKSNRLIQLAQLRHSAPWRSEPWT